MNSSEITSIYQTYHATINMSYAELLKWSRNPCSHKASLDRKPINRNLKLLSKPKSKWTQLDAREANKTISFISRMKMVKSGNAISGCGLSKRDISLLNWAYDTRKR